MDSEEKAERNSYGGRQRWDLLPGMTSEPGLFPPILNTYRYININGYPHDKTPTILPSNTVRLCLRAGAVSFERVQIFLALSRARNQCCGIGNT